MPTFDWLRYEECRPQFKKSEKKYYSYQDWLEDWEKLPAEITNKELTELRLALKKAQKIADRYISPSILFAVSDEEDLPFTADGFDKPEISDPAIDELITVAEQCSSVDLEKAINLAAEDKPRTHEEIEQIAVTRMTAHFHN